MENFVNSKKMKKVMAVISILAIIGCSCVFAFAADAAGTAIKSTMSYFISYVVDMFRVVGILIGVYAIAQFALAFKDDNPDAKQKSTVLLVIAVLLIMCKTLAEKVISIAGVSGITLDQGFLS